MPGKVVHRHLASAERAPERCDHNHLVGAEHLNRELLLLARQDRADRNVNGTVTN